MGGEGDQKEKGGKSLCQFEMRAKEGNYHTVQNRSVLLCVLCEEKNRNSGEWGERTESDGSAEEGARSEGGRRQASPPSARAALKSELATNWLTPVTFLLHR